LTPAGSTTAHIYKDNTQHTERNVRNNNKIVHLLP
jgi:hypothetical protein